MVDLFDRDEDRKFSDYVRRYNSLAAADEEKMRMEQMIVDRTKKLLYLIPKRYGFLDDDDLAAFFLDMQKDLGRLIASYTISGTSYLAYLKQICRMRSRRYRRNKGRMELTEYAMLRDAVPVTRRGYYSSEMKETEKSYSAAERKEAAECKALTMQETVSRLISGTRPKKAEKSKLGKKLTEKKSRKAFLMYLLSIPEESEPEDLKDVASVLGSSEVLLSRFLELKHEIVLEDLSRKSRIERLERLADTYWIYQQKAGLALELAWDSEHREKLNGTYERYKRLHRDKQRQVVKLKRGLTQQQIASVFGCSRATVSVYLAEARKLLEARIKQKAQ